MLSIESNTRANPQIWKMAEWLYGRMWAPDHFSDESVQLRNFYYDTSLEFHKKAQNNEFAGEDTHKD